MQCLLSEQPVISSPPVIRNQPFILETFRKENPLLEPSPAVTLICEDVVFPIRPPANPGSNPQIQKD